MIEYREATLWERMKFRWQRLNPLSRRETPVIESPAPSQPTPALRPIPEQRLPYTPAPPVDGPSDQSRRPNRAHGRATSSQDHGQDDFKPARIAGAGSQHAMSEGGVLHVDPWPYSQRNPSRMAVGPGVNPPHTGATGFVAGESERSHPTPTALTTPAPVERIPVRNFR